MLSSVFGVSISIVESIGSLFGSRHMWVRVSSCHGAVAKYRVVSAAAMLI